MTKPLTPGDAAPPLDLPALDQGRIRLDDRRGRPVIVSFLQEAGSPTCREHVARLHEHRDAVLQAGSYVVLVAFDDSEALREGVLDGVDLAFPVGLDRARDAYRAWGLGRARLWRGANPLAPRQLGGDFVVDRGGTIVYAHLQQKKKSDRPPVEELLEVVRKLERMD
jgi:peroxiredoxin